MTAAVRTSGYGSGTAAQLRRTSAAVGTCFVILVLFVICFPKGGIKPGGLPLTWGYMLIGLIGLFALPTLSPPPRRALMAYLCTLPFQAIVVPLGLYAATGSHKLGFVYSTLLNYAVFPLIYYVLFSGKLRALSWRVFAVTFKWAIRFIATYGIFLFFFKIGTGNFIEIPYLTVNVGDLGQLEDKNIMRGDTVAKLISTYNNGNIYGACFAMLLPVYLVIERSRPFVLIAWLSLFLTVSRTAWFGGFFLVTLIYFIGEKPTASRMVQGLFMLLFGAIAVTVLLELIGREPEFLFDPSLGNRLPRYEAIWADLPLIPTGRVGAIGEISYLGILKDYGIVGLLAFLPLLFAPVLLSRSGPHARHPLRRAARLGLVAYLFMSLSDGAMLLIPVMAIFYFMSLIAMEGHVLFSEESRHSSQIPKGSATKRLKRAAHHTPPSPRASANTGSA